VRTAMVAGFYVLCLLAALCILFMLPVSALAQPVNAQELVVEPFTAPNVLVAGRGNGRYPANIDAFLGTQRTAETNYWLPFAITVSNNADQEIVAFAARWTLTDSNGNETNKVMTRSLFQTPDSKVGPGKTVVLLPFWLLGGEPPGLRNLNPADYQASELPGFQNARKVRIVLDGIVFASGQFIGPNTAGEYEQLLAESTAGLNLATTLIAKRDAGVPVSAIVEWLQQTAAKQPANGSLLSRDWNTARTARQAAIYLRTYRSGGEVRMYTMAQQELQRPHLRIYR
jgi:hypothetical protein